MGHESCNVCLGFWMEGLHFRDELQSGCYMDVIVDLEIQELGALESMIFITNISRCAEHTRSKFRRSLGMPTQFDIQAVTGSSE